jgi:hypothetical protein
MPLNPKGRGRVTCPFADAEKGSTTRNMTCEVGASVLRPVLHLCSALCSTFFVVYSRYHKRW